MDLLRGTDLMNVVIRWVKENPNIDRFKATYEVDGRDVIVTIVQKPKRKRALITPDRKTG